MNEKVLKVLEYNKIIDMLEKKASSPPGKEKARMLKPMCGMEDIKKAQKETAAAYSRIIKKGSTSFGNNKDIGSSLKSLEKGSALSVTELLNIAAFLENVSRIKNYGKKDRENEAEDVLTPYFDALIPLFGISAEIRRCILSEEEFADDASVTLKQIRRSMGTVNEKIHHQLTNILNGSGRTYLQEAVITMRNNRYCLPVKAEYKNQIQGMIHDQSSSGSTLFIEPAGVVSLNNELKELFLKEKEEIEAILVMLSGLCAEHMEEMSQNQELMTTLDFIFAKGNLAADMNAMKPEFNTEHYVNIRKGRHPLLDKKTVVPIDISLGKEYDLLVITGPNTGGKTVSLKTLGLLTLMGQAGLHIPAADRSELSVFTEVFADIGDEQSIEQSLSTFSSHIRNIVEILDKADENSLCLFDELGAGTDPTEGAALAISILNYLHEKKIRSMATTHYSELKVYAMTESFVENACCEFDVESLKPTYRLLIGIPGKSNAFAISSKLGISDTIINKAKSLIGKQEQSFEDLLGDLEKSRLIIEKEQNDIEKYKREIQDLKEQLTKKHEKIDASKDRILKDANEQAKEILREAKEVADETIRAMQKAGQSGVSMKELEKKRQKVGDEINKKNNKLSVSATNSQKHRQLRADEIRLGDGVKIVSMGLKGTVSSLPDNKGNLFVQCGIMRSKVNISDLVLVEEEVITSGMLQKTNTGKIRMSKSFQVSPEINLLGQTVDEALSVLDKYLDDAYLAHLPSVRVVHGKGTGALRQGVQNYLKRVSYVESFRLGELGEGDAGVTIVTFKK